MFWRVCQSRNFNKLYVIQQRQRPNSCLTSLIAQLTQQIAQIQAQQGTTPTAWCHTFNNNLGYANSGSVEVGYLHTTLNQEGISYAPDTGNTYTVATGNAVSALQVKYAADILSPVGLISGTGYFGSSTRNKVNKIYGCSSLVQSNPCTEADWQYFLASCRAGGLQAKTWRKVGICTGGVTHPATENINCSSLNQCTEADWSSSLFPAICPLAGTQTNIWAKVGNCTGGVTHPATETISCDQNMLTCTSFNYSDWSECSSSGIQTRTVASSYPSGCQGGRSVTQQNCAPACTDDNWTYIISPSACAAGTQTIIWTKVGSCTGGVTHPGSDTISCQPLYPFDTSLGSGCSCSSWANPGLCINGRQAKTCTQLSPSSCNPVTMFESCTPASITLDSPNGGETWTATTGPTSRLITWTSKSLPSNALLSIQLHQINTGFPGRGDGFFTVASYVPASVGSYLLTIPSADNGSDKIWGSDVSYFAYQVIITCTNCSSVVRDESDSTFKINLGNNSGAAKVRYVGGQIVGGALPSKIIVLRTQNISSCTLKYPVAFPVNSYKFLYNIPPNGYMAVPDLIVGKVTGEITAICRGIDGELAGGKGDVITLPNEWYLSHPITDVPKIEIPPQN